MTEGSPELFVFHEDVEAEVLREVLPDGLERGCGEEAGGGEGVGEDLGEARGEDVVALWDGVPRRGDEGELALQGFGIFWLEVWKDDGRGCGGFTAWTGGGCFEC